MRTATIRALAATLALASLGACGRDGRPGGAPTPTAASPSPIATVAPPADDAIEVEAEDVAFDVDVIEARAGTQISIEFKNRDDAVPHNIAIYRDESAAGPIFMGETITGDADTVYTFEVPEEPGEYFFRCDVHPTQMTGTFRVT